MCNLSLLRGGEGTTNWDTAASNRSTCISSCSTGSCSSKFNKRMSSKSSNWSIWDRTTRIYKFELEEGFQPYHPPFRNLSLPTSTDGWRSGRAPHLPWTNGFEHVCRFHGHGFIKASYICHSLSGLLSLPLNVISICLLLLYLSQSCICANPWFRTALGLPRRVALSLVTFPNKFEIVHWRQQNHTI